MTRAASRALLRADVGKKLELAIGILNGAVGDWLARSGNGLAIEMTCVVAGEPIAAAELARSQTPPKDRLVVLVHGLMCTESVWEMPDGSADYGARLGTALDATPIYLRYNTGLAIPDNGAALSSLLTALVEAWPTPIREIIPIGYSMGGLVLRSATHVASLEGGPWLGRIRRTFYVGTPHLGAPLERVGRVATRVLRAIDDPVVRLIADIADLRSDGVKDLGDADLRHEDRARRTRGLGLRDPRHPVPLLDGIAHHLAAGSLSLDPRLAGLFGDAVVPLPSSTDGRCVDAPSIAFPPERVAVFPGVDHVTLAHHPEVAERLLSWITSGESVEGSPA